MDDWNMHPTQSVTAARHEDGEGWDHIDAVDRELEAAIEYKLAVSGFAGVADVVELLDRAIRRRWVSMEAG